MKSKNKSKINLTDVFNEHKQSLLTTEGKYSSADRFCFVILPIILTIVCVFLLGVPSDRLINIFSTTLSIFIGMFLNLLALIVTFSKNVNNVKDTGNRSKLIKQTFSNTCYTIVLSIVAFSFLLLTSIKVDFLEIFDFNVKSKYLLSVINVPIDKDVTIVNVLCFISTIFFYWYFTKVIISLLMVVKRIHKIFKVEINYASQTNSNPNEIRQFEEFTKNK